MASHALPRARRTSREPHTIGGGAFLEARPSPVLDGPATPPSSLLQQYSSVGPPLFGLASTDTSGAAPFPPFPPFPPAHWLLAARDVPWMPPPPLLPPDNAALWPSPRDIPLPSAFPLPPAALPPPMFGFPPPPPFAPPAHGETTGWGENHNVPSPTRHAKPIRKPTPNQRNTKPTPNPLKPTPNPPKPTPNPPKPTPRSNPGPTPPRKDFYAAARALRGAAPKLEDALIDRREAPRNGAQRRAASRPKKGAAYGREVPIREARVGEYLKGIEDLYQRLRESYAEFQRDPSRFVRDTAALREAARTNAKNSSAVSCLLDDTHEARRVSPPPHASPTSRESQRLREELMRLETQWQRLEELKRGVTGERGAAPMEMPQEESKIRDMPAPTRRTGMSDGRQKGNGKVTDAPSRGSTPSGAVRSRSGSSVGSREPFTRERVLGLVRERKAMLE